MGGEASAESIRNWQSKLKDTVLLVNEYGPTETTVSALYYPISKQIPSDRTHVPIGKPIANTNIYILNEHLQLCPIGVIGELYIESIGTAIGYHNQPERTAQSFVSHPFLQKHLRGYIEPAIWYVYRKKVMWNIWGAEIVK